MTEKQGKKVGLGRGNVGQIEAISGTLTALPVLKKSTDATRGGRSSSKGKEMGEEAN